jgi:hypothetical protein
LPTSLSVLDREIASVSPWQSLFRQLEGYFPGQKFAMLEMKSVISKVIRHFELTPAVPRHELILSVETVLRSANGIKVGLKKRI